MNWQIIVGIFFVIGGIGNFSNDIGTFLGCTAIGLILLFLGLSKKGVFRGKMSQASEAESRILREEVFHAVGVHYYEDSVKKLATTNPDWKLSRAKIIESGMTDKKIFQYYYVNKPVKLQQEPNNEHDKNAIAVIVAGEKVGYISREENVHVGEILAKHEIKALSGFIGGGKYKIVAKDGTAEEFQIDHNVNVKIKYV